MNRRGFERGDLRHLVLLQILHFPGDCWHPASPGQLECRVPDWLGEVKGNRELHPSAHDGHLELVAGTCRDRAHEHLQAGAPLLGLSRRLQLCKCLI